MILYPLLSIASLIIYYTQDRSLRTNRLQKKKIINKKKSTLHLQPLLSRGG